MAAAKKTVKPVAVATQASAPTEKAEVSATKKVEPTTTVKTEEKAEKPAAAKKETVKKETVKKETVKKAPAKKAPAKKTTVKKETAKKAPAKKVELNSKVHIEFPDKSYTQEDLIKIAKDVWHYDLKQKVSDLTSIDLYVKAEEKTVYYVMNMEFKGSFGI